MTTGNKTNQTRNRKSCVWLWEDAWIDGPMAGFRLSFLLGQLYGSALSPSECISKWAEDLAEYEKMTKIAYAALTAMAPRLEEK